MPRTTKRTKASFTYDDQGRAVLGSAKEMAAWVKLGFEEQNKRKTQDEEKLLKKYIDFTNCVLYISYPVGDKTAPNKIFNFCELAGIVPGIEKIDGDPNYLFEVKYDILFDKSELYGNFFHYVKFGGMVSMDGAIVKSTFSCFKCHFREFALMQRLYIMGRSDFEQCEFCKGLVLSGAKSHLFHFNYCSFKNRLSLSSVNLDNHHHEGYHQSIQFTNCSVENLNLSSIDTDGLPVFCQSTSIEGMEIDNVKLENVLLFESCSLGGVITSVKDEKSTNNHIKELVFHSCDVMAQFHVENNEIEKFLFSFSKIEEKGRIRLAGCKVNELNVGSSSVFGQLDLIENKINTISIGETCVQGHLNFQENQVEKYNDRQTLRLLKDEALKVNDDVAATKMYAEEMRFLLTEEGSVTEKASLWLDRLFSNFGQSWLRALLVTFIFSITLTSLMLGFGSAKYGFNPSGEFMGLGAFITSWLDSINVFSIPLFSDTIKEYNLNVWGQMLYFLIKVVVAYGTYQFIVSFRKYGRK